jgi:hypothetical protein
MDEKKTGSDTLHIYKLNETNYRAWSQQMKWIFDEKDLLEIVLGTEARPTPPSAQGEASIATVASITAAAQFELLQTKYQADLALYTKKVKKARSLFGSTVSQSVMVYIEGLEEPSEMWRVLENKYSPKTQVAVMDGWVDLGMDARRIGNNGMKYNGVARWRSASRSTYYKQAVAMPNHVRTYGVELYKPF